MKTDEQFQLLINESRALYRRVLEMFLRDLDNPNRQGLYEASLHIGDSLSTGMFATFRIQDLNTIPMPEPDWESYGQDL